MATLTSIRSGLKTRLETISGLDVYDYVPDWFEPPMALIMPPEIIDYDVTMSRGADRYEIPVVLYVTKIDAETSQDDLDSYLASSGSTSVKAAVEGDGTLGGAAMDTRVISAGDYGGYEISQGTTYLGVTFTVEVIA
jgi:hypothetical protein